MLDCCSSAVRSNRTSLTQVIPGKAPVYGNYLWIARPSTGKGGHKRGAEIRHRVINAH